MIEGLLIEKMEEVKDNTRAIFENDGKIMPVLIFIGVQAAEVFVVPGFSNVQQRNALSGLMTRLTMRTDCMALVFVYEASSIEADDDKIKEVVSGQTPQGAGKDVVIIDFGTPDFDEAIFSAEISEDGEKKTIGEWVKLPDDAVVGRLVHVFQKSKEVQNSQEKIKDKLGMGD